MYRIVAVKRNGKAQTWEPVTSVFTDNPMPTADIHTKKTKLSKSLTCLYAKLTQTIICVCTYLNETKTAYGVIQFVSLSRMSDQSHQ